MPYNKLGVKNNLFLKKNKTLTFICSSSFQYFPCDLPFAPSIYLLIPTLFMFSFQCTFCTWLDWAAVQTNTGVHVQCCSPRAVHWRRITSPVCPRVFSEAGTIHRGLRELPPPTRSPSPAVTPTEVIFPEILLHSRVTIFSHLYHVL